MEKRHHWVVRATHWVNAVALTLMVMSGLRIFDAYPGFARKGGAFCCYPFEGKEIPRAFTFGGGLSGARNWHFAMMWVLALNGLVYLSFIYLHGEWRDLVPRRGDLRDAWQMVRFYLYVRRDHPHQGKHNALQKGAYFSLPLLGILAVLTGLAIWKPVQLAPLTHLFGGYAWARYWHFLVMLALVVTALGHVFMVFAVDPASLPSMITGRYDESRSPEALNARPFHRGRPESHSDAGSAAYAGSESDEQRTAPQASDVESRSDPNLTRDASHSERTISVDEEDAVAVAASRPVSDSSNEASGEMMDAPAAREEA